MTVHAFETTRLVACLARYRHNLDMSTTSSGAMIARCIYDSLPRYWDGRECVEELRTLDFQWRQMEWIGWWFEHRAMQVLAPYGAKGGPTFGSVAFDCELNGIWDFKTHTRMANRAGYAYLNDQWAVDACVASRQHLGWIIAIGTSVYDETGDFKRWHDQLKGEESKYVTHGRAIGRRSRKRKAAFLLDEVVWFEFRSHEDIDVAVSSDVLRRGLQAQQQNSNGSSRRPKYGFSYARWCDYLKSSAPTLVGGRVLGDPKDR